MSKDGFTVIEARVVPISEKFVAVAEVEAEAIAKAWLVPESGVDVSIAGAGLIPAMGHIPA